MVMVILLVMAMATVIHQIITEDLWEVEWELEVL